MSWINLNKPQGDHFQRAIREIESGSDRAVGVVAGSFVEDHLQTAIEHRLVPHPTLTKDMFRPSGPFGAFSNKITLGFMLGLYSDEARKELDTIKEIRNAFAHKLDVSEFTHQRINDLANNLTLADTVELYISVPDGKLEMGGRLVITLGEKPAEGPFAPFFTPLDVAGPRQRYVRACQLFIAVFSLAPIMNEPEYRGLL